MHLRSKKKRAKFHEERLKALDERASASIDDFTAKHLKEDEVRGINSEVDYIWQGVREGDFRAFDEFLEELDQKGREAGVNFGHKRGIRETEVSEAFYWVYKFRVLSTKIEDHKEVLNSRMVEHISGPLLDYLNAFLDQPCIVGNLLWAVINLSIIDRYPQDLMLHQKMFDLIFEVFETYMIDEPESKDILLVAFWFVGNLIVDDVKVAYKFFKNGLT